MEDKKKQIVVAVSGGFDPVHVGHVRMFQDAKKLGDKLIVILNNDNWLREKKGFVFMPQEERAELIRHIKWVDDVVLTEHKLDTKDMSICNELRKIHPHIFVNGGDRKLDNIPEVDVCNQINCKMIFNIGQGGKVQSSSWLVSGFLKDSLCPYGSSKKYKKCHGK
ncbi:adenylyltransferase/cytidyltransferase family protein, partial [Patescibacteria group bacterium]|nr:adenylyltransferase/cytidyltransferase family protein [Patescibacteria group bacterium]